MNKQRALLIIKPDAVRRGLIGKIVKRFEMIGLTIIGLKFIQASKEMVGKHYPDNDEWYKKVGNRTLTNYAKKGLDPVAVFKTTDPVIIGKAVKGWLVDFFQESPVFVFAVEGYETIEVIRKLCGHTMPIFSAPGTIRGDFSHDTINLANSNNRALRNIIHASDTLEDADSEIKLWFKPEELFSYSRCDSHIMFP